MAEADRTEIDATRVDADRQTCRRCGTCCIKGGPALHRSDKDAVMNGTIPAKDLFTIRAGEPAYDNIAGTVFHAETDIIKIKNSGFGQGCIYLDRPDGRCSIYAHRPIECRLLECWNTARIEAAYARNRLIRRDVLGSVAGVWEVVVDHQKRCSYDTVGLLAKRLKAKHSREDERALLEMVRYDAAIRDLVVKKSGVDTGLLLFLFGRPLEQTCAMYDLHLKADGGILIV